jgi:hypothetical protein
MFSRPPTKPVKTPSRVKEPDAFFGCQGVQPDRRIVEVLPPGRDERVHSSTNRQVGLKHRVLGEIVEDQERRARQPVQATPDLLHLLRFISLRIDLDAGGFADLRNEGGQAPIGIDPINAARINRPKPVCVFDGELRLPKTARADDNDFASQDGCAVAEERIMEVPERVHPPDELLTNRTVRHAMSLWQRTDRRQLRPVGEGGILARRAAEFMANPGVVRLKVRDGGDIDCLDLAEKARKGGEVPARPQHQRPYLASEPSGIVGDAAGSLDFHPLGVAEIW